MNTDLWLHKMTKEERDKLIRIIRMKKMLDIAERACRGFLIGMLIGTCISIIWKLLF